MPIHITINWISFIFPLFFLLAAFLSTFLFWRAGRHELIESDFLMDVLIIFSIGAILGGRLFDFFLGYSQNHLSILWLLFFNRFGGFDFFGAFFGAFVAVWLFLRRRRYDFMQICDLAAAPIVFFRVITTIGHFAGYFIGSGFSNNSLFFLSRFISYFAIFWIIKRLETKKRHKGFFAGFYLVSTGFVDTILYYVFPVNRILFDKYPYQLMISGVLLVAGVVFWYKVAKRKPRNDLKNFFGSFLLLVFGTGRTLTNLRDADRFAKFIIFLPYTLAKALWAFVKLVVREISSGFADFAKAMGIGK